MLSWSRTVEEIVTRTQTGEKRKKKDKRKSHIKQKAVNTSNMGNSHYAQYFCFAAVGSAKHNSKCNQVGKGVAMYNLPPLNVMTHDDVTSSDLKSVLPQPFSLQSL